MSVKFLRDHGLWTGRSVDLPPNGAGGVIPGTRFLDQVTGNELMNEGVLDDAFFFDRGVGPDLMENWLQKPGINADSDVPAANTFNTAQAQLGLDANRNFEISGTNATSALCTFSATGGITLTTAGATNDQMLVGPHTNANATQWNAVGWQASKRVLFDMTILTGASVAAITFFAGLKLTTTPVAATDADQAYFRFSTADTIATKIQALAANTAVLQTLDSGVVVAAASAYRLQIKTDKARVPWFFVNGVRVAPAATALKATTSLKPFFGVQALAAAAKAVTFRYVRCAQKF